MSRNKIVTFFSILCLISLFCTSVFAFDTSNGGSWDAVAAKSGKWGYAPYTGTRYVFRIKCFDGVYRDVGYDNEIVDASIKNKGALYYINHFQDKSRNFTQYEENSGKTVNEIIQMGSSLLGYNQVFSGASYFDTKASSTNSYESSNGNHRHITIWIRTGDDNKKHENNIITNDFDVNASDIRKLANTVKDYAISKGDSKTLSQINEIMEGKVSYQIRTESLFKVHITEGASNLRGSYDDKDISAYVKGSDYSLLTFRECRALQKGAEMGASSTTLFNASGYVTKGATLLWEANNPWYEEYADLYNDFLSGTYKGKNFKYIGWDYLQVDAENNPFNKITVRYKDEVTGEDLLDPEEGSFDEVISKKDIPDYEYTGLEEVTPEPKEKDPNKSEIKIPNDGESHEIIFWYRPSKTTIKINYKNETTGELIPGFTNPEYFQEPGTYSKKDLESQGYTYTGVEINTPDYVAKDLNKTSVTIPDDKKAHEITFWYKLQTQVRIIGKCEGRTGFIYTKDLGKQDLPLKQTYKESSYTPSNYTYLNEYEVKYGTLTYTGKGTTSSGKEVTLDIEGSTTAPKQVLIVFYYKSNYTANVEHYYVDPITNAEELRKSNTINITPGVSKDLSSIHMNDKNGTHCINLKYDGTNINANGFKQYSKDLYTLTFTPGESNYTIKFYYTSQVITVKHERTDGSSLKDPETKILNPTEEEKPLADYTFKDYVLNGESPKTDVPVKVPQKDGVPSQELIFVYKDPDLVFTGDENEYGTGIIPNDLNNQFISQKEEKYYWVLNEKGEVTIRLAVGHMDSGTHNITCNLQIPFDVYINNEYKKANTVIKVDCKFTEIVGDHDVYVGTVKNIYVPVWAEEKEHELKATVNYVYTSKDGVASPTLSSTATEKVTVVGAVYDFTITNLDGSDTTGDSMWKKALFPTTKEYKAKDTAIGQGTQQPSKYYNAIKRGTRFYFSLNTLGADNNQIEIVPSFYYISDDGKTITSVTMKSNYIKSTRSINLNDTNRVTTEFSNERKMKSTIDANTLKAGTVFDVGNYSKITLNRNVNTPYLGIINDVKAKFAGKEITAILQGTAKTDKDLYKVANHWYGDYSIPNDATFYKKDGTQVDENGYLVVYFSIITRNNANSEYLAYNLESPFVQTQKISEWNLERKGNNLSSTASYTLTLPKTNVNNTKTASTGNVWILGTNKAGHTATIIYSLKQNVSTKQNVTSAGTH